MNEIAAITQTDIANSAPTTTDEQAIHMWLHGRSSATTRAYRTDVDRFVAFAAAPLRMIDLATIQAYADHLACEELSTASRARMLASVKSLFAFAHKLGYVPFDTARAVRLPAIKGKLAERILSEAQVLRMIGEASDNESAIDRRNRVLLLVMYAAGLRNSEVRLLLWRDTAERDAGGQITVVGKGDKVRVVRLPQTVWGELLAIRGAATDDEPIFRSREHDDDGKARGLDQASINRVVQAFAKKAGIKKEVSPHWLRHAHASHSIERGSPIHLVQATLGHASVATTGKYLHARPGESSSRYLAIA